eukprot:4712840-Amphidinium_carterae.1
MESVDLMEGKRTVTLDYRGLSFSTVIRSAEEELELALRAAIRGAGAHMGLLGALGEAELAADGGHCVKNLS